MPYIDAFILPVQIEHEAEYLRMAQDGCRIWMEHGALSYIECRADDVPQGQTTSFPLSVKLQPGEVVYVSYITYRDRAHRDEVNAKVMADTRLHGYSMDRPVDMKRMIFGGFVPVVSATA